MLERDPTPIKTMAFALDLHDDRTGIVTQLLASEFVNECRQAGLVTDQEDEGGARAETLRTVAAVEQVLRAAWRGSFG